MKKKQESPFKFILLSFLVWRVFVLLVGFVAVKFVPLRENFLGGGLGNYLSSPLFWMWSNFDGEHYLSIAQNGYGQGEQAFFPLYPLLIRILGNVLGGGLVSYQFAGLAVSNLSFILALWGLYKLVRFDYSNKVAKLLVVLFLVFPTSFYFGAVYTESFFLALIVWSFYFFRKKTYFFSFVLGMLAAATRVVGVALFAVYLVELGVNVYKERNFYLKYLLLGLIPLGILGYMLYLHQTTGDGLAFIHSLPGFGEQRSATPIILPQVFYRYFFKILPNVDYSYFPVVFTTLMEVLAGFLFLGVLVLSFWKLRLGYSLFLLAGYILPTLSGSFSSLPRYVVILFPAFLIFALYLSGVSKKVLFLVLFLLLMGLTVATAMFVRGYWVS